MTVLSHKGILGAGRYRGVNIGKGEAETARLILRFMLRLADVRGGGWPANIIPRRDAMSRAFCIGQEAVPGALSVLCARTTIFLPSPVSWILSFKRAAPMDALFADCMASTPGQRRLAGSRTYRSFTKFFSGAILAGATGHFSRRGLAASCARGRK